jgi:hypothetical protein
MLKDAVKGAPRVHQEPGSVTELGSPVPSKYPEGTLGLQAPVLSQAMSGMLSVEPSGSVKTREVLQLEFHSPWTFSAAFAVQE